MTLRSRSKLQQLLFLSACALACSAGAVQAQDLVILQGDRQQQGKIVGASPAGVQIQIGQGVITLPMSTLKEVRMAAVPPEYAAAQKAFLAKDYNGAMTALKALDKFRGLPTEWAQQAAAMMGDLFLEQGQMDKAEAAYKDFQKLYPAAQGGPQAEVGMARLAVAKKDFSTAQEKLEPISTKALQEPNVPSSLGYAYSQTFLLLGQIKEAGGDFPGALENYLRTVTLFYHDRAAVAKAQEKADALRKAHPEVFIP